MSGVLASSIPVKIDYVSIFLNHPFLKGLRGLFATTLGRKNSLTREKVFPLIAAIRSTYNKFGFVRYFPSRRLLTVLLTANGSYISLQKESKGTGHKARPE